MEDLAYPLNVIVDDGYPLPLADSCAIAHLFVDLMMSRKLAIEERDGPIRFGRSNDEQYALLTTDQAYGAMAPIPTTKEARVRKQRVGLAFDNAYEGRTRSGLPGSPYPACPDPLPYLQRRSKRFVTTVLRSSVLITDLAPVWRKPWRDLPRAKLWCES